MARESLTSDVVVTTPTGFATMIVGRERKAFFEEALQQFDVVLFDEADRVQAQLDGCFAPSMSFQELIRNAADPTAVAMKRRPDDNMRDFNEELFYDLRQKSEPVAKALLKSVRDDRVAKWRIVKDEAFTSLSLLNLSLIHIYRSFRLADYRPALRAGLDSARHQGEPGRR